MLKLIKFCKIIWALFALFTVGDLIMCIIITFTGSESTILVHTGGPQMYISSFFWRVATVTFNYFFTVFVEKWCEKNGIK